MGLSPKALSVTILTLSLLAVHPSPAEEDFEAPNVEALASSAISLKEIIGFVAGFGTTFAALPDLITMLKRQSSQGMNPTMASIMGVFQIVWVYYGLLIASRPVIIWNVVAVVINSIMVGSYYYFLRCEREQVKS